jgi:hypothetical protein
MGANATSSTLYLPSVLWFLPRWHVCRFCLWWHLNLDLNLEHYSCTSDILDAC